MKFKIGVVILGILVLLIGGYVGMTLTMSYVHASQTSGPMGKPFPSKTQSQSVGLSAIIPKSVSNQATSNAPRISKTDVENYLKIHQFAGGSAIPGKTPKLLVVDYITSKEASQRLKNESIGLADSAMVYYVKWQGPFNPEAAMKVPPGAIIPTSVSYGVEVFDAQTGNLLLWSIPN